MLGLTSFTAKNVGFLITDNLWGDLSTYNLNENKMINLIPSDIMHNPDTAQIVFPLQCA